MLKKLLPTDLEVISVKYISKFTPRLILPALSIGIFEKPVVPITTLFFNLEAILSISKVHLGTVKSIMTLVFLKAVALFIVGFIPEIFLFIFLLSVKETSLKPIFFLDDLISCWPILPIHPVIDKFIFLISL